MNCNQAIICGKINKTEALRYTPAGVAVIEFEVAHSSEQIEAKISRKVICNFSAVAFAQKAHEIADIKPDTLVRLSGFFANKSLMSRHLVLHVKTIDQQFLSEQQGNE